MGSLKVLQVSRQIMSETDARRSGGSLMGLGLEKVRYEKNFLSNVIFRVDYHPILVLRNSILPQFQESIRAHLPIFQEQKGFELRAEIKDGAPEGSTTPVTSWILLDKSERFKLTINYSFLAIEDAHYTSLDDYLTKIQQITQAFSTAYQKPEYTRIGLRYVNTIQLSDGDPLDWSDHIADFLTCSLRGFAGNRQQLSRAMGQFVLNRDEYQVTWSYGIFNPEFPTKIARRQFILDYDCFSSDVSTDLIGQIRTFNLAILGLFEDSIKEPLRKQMGATHASKE